MSLIRELAEMDRAARAQGSSLSQVIAFAGRAGPGVDVFLRRPLAEASFDPSDADTLEELKDAMTKLAAALAALTLEAEEQKTQLAGVVTYVQNVPNLIAAAVADALAKAPGIDEAAAAAAIDAARQSVSDATDGVLTAIVANTPAAPDQPPGNATAETPVTEVTPETTPATGATADAVTAEPAPVTDPAPATGATETADNPNG